MSATLQDLQAQTQRVNQLLATLADHWEDSTTARKYEELYTLSQEASKIAFFAAYLHGALKREEIGD